MSRLLGDALAAWAVWRAWKARKTTSLAALQRQLNTIRAQRRDALYFANNAPFFNSTATTTSALRLFGIYDPPDLYWNGTMWVRR